MKTGQSSARAFGRKALARLAVACLLLPLLPSSAFAFRLIGSPVGGWVRWDAAPRSVEGVERSLDGGLRYSIETGSYVGLRDQFSWVPEVPSEEAFEQAITRAFEHWTVVDPETALPGAFYFVEDLGTVAVDQPENPTGPGGFLGLNAGAEIDIFAATPHAGPSFAASVRFFLDTTEHDLTLTSGTTNYPGFALSGVDIRINPIYSWSLSGFELLLTHEIGHALGFADLEAPTVWGSTSAFMDDDYDPATSETALATLTNSFALSINPLHPDGSPLRAFAGDINRDPGLDTPSAKLLMESGGIFDLLLMDPVLQNDEFAGRQFLYPVPVPEPGIGAMLWAGVGGLALLAGRRRIRE